MLLDRFIKNWKAKAFAAPDQQVLLAISGGVDSMVMAHLFLKSGIKFAIAHCNFQLRAGEADKDEQLVQQWAQENGIVFHSIRFNTQQKMEEWKKGVQETARILRYEWLDKLCSDHAYARLVTAHHANDNVETLLMNLFKGTGMSGLHGIPVQNANIVRPLLDLQKEDILNYAAEHTVPYRDDASNAKDVYLRNAVRLNIIPQLEQHFPNVVQHISDSIARFAQGELLYNKAVAQERKKLLEQRGQDHYIPVAKLKKHIAPEAMIYEISGDFGFTAAQVPQILQLLDSESGHYVSSATHRIIRNRDFLVITTLAADAADMILIEALPCKVNVGKHSFTFSIEKKPAQLPTDTTIACIDMKNITLPLILRRWRIGDYFYPLGMGMKKKKVSRYLIDQKVALHDKEHVWVFESSRRIAWLAGMRLDERFKVKDNTAEVLVVKMSV